MYKVRYKMIILLRVCELKSGHVSCLVPDISRDLNPWPSDMCLLARAFLVGICIPLLLITLPQLVASTQTEAPSRGRSNNHCSQRHQYQESVPMEQVRTNFTYSPELQRRSKASITENFSHQIFFDIIFSTLVLLHQKPNVKNQNYESLSYRANEKLGFWCTCQVVET